MRVLLSQSVTKPVFERAGTGRVIAVRHATAARLEHRARRAEAAVVARRRRAARAARAIERLADRDCHSALADCRRVLNLTRTKPVFERAGASCVIVVRHAAASRLERRTRRARAAAVARRRRAARAARAIERLADRDRHSALDSRRVSPAHHADRRPLHAPTGGTRVDETTCTDRAAANCIAVAQHRSSQLILDDEPREGIPSCHHLMHGTSTDLQLLRLLEIR